MEKVVCIGCGVTIQTEDNNGLGYAPPASLTKENVICQRCFRLKNYNEIQDVSLTDDDFLNILHGIGETDSLIVKIVDIFDFNGSWINGLNRLVGGNPILLVGNKADILPKSLKRERLIQWMKREAKEYGLKPLDVFLVSASRGQGIKEVIDAIEHYRQGRDVYVVGCTNVGKSTFINRIIKEVSGEENIITTSQFPGTTLDAIKIPLDDGSALYDTPGIINRHQMAHYVNKRDLKVLTPKKELKPRTFQLNDQQTLYFGGLARFDYVSGARSAFVCYMPNDLLIHRTKLENADALYEKHAGELLTPPGKDDMDEFPELTAHTFTIKEPKTDIVFSGLGWVTVQEAEKKITAYAPKGVHVFVRRSLI
ncbi:ribosome biogenesis GTPase YqeH [Bacillus atrophaeus]|uniref:ribosome biogenesis GTPase YqeH n=1 Tax=Bacillus atrophaeus TaxID=1452 RepID=UPI0022816168|nr:ribosome biogenesis GTPase YqeH [Bacillus atrophaeus]MCY8909671.1 ribosome biogenesis GTPase YqeH [Bacillus atrophaeus]MEC0837689.1 ribosome biogenesis GTPase YqeH [Bacillus atrophaeus]MEC0845344.1 ribosome biogenesis GTPase YqeH [Bacillus atrophaeus]MEC0851450.1 ribosome biogenesis GTPase YqeH [Bacillus atrophaeus]MEC0867601.1 ribosome biogenesis GTPase YqeH [Bacillus atrophaeus]